MAFLRLAENPRNMVSGMRLLALLPGIGPGRRSSSWKRLPAARSLGGACRPAKGEPCGRLDAASRGQRLWPDLVGSLDATGRLETGVDRPGPARFACSTRRCWSSFTTIPIREPETWNNWSSLPRGCRRPAGASCRRSRSIHRRFEPQDMAGPPGTGRRLPGAEHDPLGQGPGVGRRLRDPRGGRQHSLGHGYRLAGRDRGRAAVVLRGPDAGEELAVRLLSVALLP